MISFSKKIKKLLLVKKLTSVLDNRKLYGELQDVCVPYMYLDKTSRRVLIMEWVQVKKTIML